MTDHPSLAFAHPSARAEASAGPVPRDRISMTEHLREVEIGAFQTERGVTQTLRFDVVVEVATRAETAADDVDRILSYDTIVEAIDAALAADRVNLLETLAVRVADGLLGHPLARRVFVRIGKLDRGPFTLGVEIVREASGVHRTPAVQSDAPHPLVVFLSAAALARADIPALLDRLEGSGAPVILCVDRLDLPLPSAGRALADRRIALLAIEQAAWVLAARDRRCVVVDSRTELDWAMRQGRISVWAPSKLVLDAGEGAAPEMVAPWPCALWLAERFDARAILGFGVDEAEGAARATLTLDAETMPDAQVLKRLCATP